MSPAVNADRPQESGAPSDRFCDLVMKGGITSGVVYPPAISALAQEYRFKNIGGTSAGAIAAAVTAAAEYRRRVTGTMDGFELLDALPARLGQMDTHGKTRLLRLFQPDPRGRRVFGILIGSLNATSTFRRVAAVVLSCLRSYWGASLASVVTSALVLSATGSITAGILWLLLTLPAFVGFRIYRDATRNLVENNYGMCKGLTTAPQDGEALTPWLHALIQRAAGLAPHEPLTFGHLWNAPDGPSPLPGAANVRSIDLQMFSTNLAHGRPYIFPHTEPTARLFYNPEELAAYLPAPVMDWFNAHALAYQPSAQHAHSDPSVDEALRLNLREIPPPQHFPVLLAARMSLSFPLLFSAVPLWAVDYEDPQGERTFRRCMFSDGGISSNFPVHLFDGLIPQWPTFGIDLEAKLPGHTNMVFLPHGYLEGVADRWTRFDQKLEAPSRMGGYLASIVSTMQNWNDNTLARMTGVRDRVVRVRLGPDEGGMNLNMPSPLIDTVAARGRLAARELIGRFVGKPPASGWDGWSFQRWVRLDVHLNALGQKIAGMQRALGPAVPQSQSYAQLVALGAVHAPPGHRAPLTPAEVSAITGLTEGLEALAKEFQSQAQNYSYTPAPPAELRAGPPL